MKKFPEEAVCFFRVAGFEGRVVLQVLQVDASRKRLILTNKRSLVKSSLPLVTSLDQCKRGMIIEGFVAQIKDNGLLVVFYDDVKVSQAFWDIFHQLRFNTDLVQGDTQSHKQTR